MAAIPVVLFAILQFRLLKDVFYSTYQSRCKQLRSDHGNFLKRKNFTRFKISHLDNNLVELDTKTKEEDDRTVLLEGGLTKSASFKQPVASIKSNLIRFVTMDDSFLLENRAALRAMSKFGGILFFFYISDRTSLIAESAKERYNEKYGVDDALDAQSGNMSNTYRRWADHVGSKNGSYYGFGSGVDGFMLQGENDEEDFNTRYNEDFVRVQEMVEQHDIDQGTMRDQLESLKRAQEAQSRKIEELLESQT